MIKRIPRIIFLLTLLLGSIFPVKAQNNYTWGNLPIGGGGFVSAIIPSKTEKNLIYARTDVGGAYRWDAANKRWIPLNDWVSEDQVGYLGVEALATDPQNPSRLYLLVGISYFNNGKSAILKSDDYGATFSIIDVTSQFKAHGNGMGRQNGEKLVVDPNNSNILYTGTRWNGLFKSTNAGTTWTRLSSLNVTTTPNENGISFVVLDGSKVAGGNTQAIFVGVSRTGSNFYRSNDGGQTFIEVTGGPANFMPQRAVLAGDGNLYITYGNGAGPHGHWAVPEPMDNGQIWKYNTNTGAWTNVTPSIARAYGGISVDPANPNRLVASTINNYMAQGSAWGDRIFISTNGGTTWTDVIARGFRMDVNGSPWIDGHAIHWAGSIEFDPFDTDKVWVTSGNGVFTTDNINANTTVWRFEVDGLEETVPLDLVSIPGGPVVSVIGDYDGFRHTDVNAYAPIHTPRMGTTTGLDYAEKNPNYLVRVGDKMYYSTDMALTWTETASMNGLKGEVGVSADGSVILHCPEQSATTYRSVNNGGSWTTVTGLSINEARPVSDPVNAAKFYAYDNNSGVMMVSTNGGISFTAAGSPGTGGSKTIRATPGMEGHLWVALYGGGLTRSTNSGQTFSKINNVSYCGAVGLGKPAPEQNYPTLYIWGTVNNQLGIHRSTDQGATWVRINDDNHMYGGPGNGQFVSGDMNEFGRVYMSTAGRGIVMGTQNPVNPDEDCAGVENGTAYIDNCGICVGGTTGKTACQKDCNDTWGGTAYNDACNTCVGGTTGLNPCAELEDGEYIISPLHSSLCLENSDPVKQQNCTKSNEQVWILTRTGDYYTFQSFTTGEYMHFSAATAGTNVNTSNIASQFRIESIGEGLYHIKPAGAHNLYFDIEGNNTTPGGNLLFWTSTGNNNQVFTITPHDVITSLNDQSLINLKYYPNPFTGSVSVEIPGIFEYSIFDLLGAKVAEGTATDQIETGKKLSPGVYYMVIRKGNHSEIIKLTKN